VHVTRSLPARFSFCVAVSSWLTVIGCRDTPPPAAPEPTKPEIARDAAGGDVIAAAAEAILRNGCASPDAVAPVPTWRSSAAPPFDVAIYTAHPDDEAMYAGGTMARLAAAQRRVAFVSMSHGEGGRLLERAADGGVEERRDYPRSHVVLVRDREVADAAARVGVTHAHLYPADANVDDAYTTSCSDALAHWQATLPGGLADALARLVADVRTRRPRVVVTLDPRDDPQASHHGHHKAVGVLAEAAARLAADARAVARGQPHVVEEVLSMAPRDVTADVVVPVDATKRVSMLEAYGSQFTREGLAVDPIAQRSVESFVVRWRAREAPISPERATLLALMSVSR